MKKIFYILLTIVAASAVWSCNKAEYITTKFVTLNSAKYNFDENAGTVAIPLSVFGVDECVVKYEIKDGTAKQGSDFTVVDKDGKPNTTGLLKVSSDAAKSDSLRFKLEYDPAKTKGKKFIVSLLSAVTEGVVVNGTRQCEVTLVDLEDAVSKFYGTWSDKDGKNVFEFEEYDIEKDPDEIAEYFPGSTLKFGGKDDYLFGGLPMGGSLYAYYDGQTKTINIHSGQVFNALNFSGIGPHFVGPANTDDEEDIVLSTEGGKLSFTSEVIIKLYTYPDGNPTKYKAGTTIDKGTVLEKRK